MNNKSKLIESKYFPIVGIGASAGGLEALEMFFENMPEKSGMAFVVVQHLDPNHNGILPELLQLKTLMKVTEIIDQVKVKPNNIYVIPHNKSLSLLNGVLHLFEPIEAPGLRLPIDVFFSSLADDLKDKSIGIILSGMGSDGSMGVKAIKEKDGLVLIQDPKTAKFDSMPRTATETVIADIVAPAGELPIKLIAFLKLSQVSKTYQGMGVTDKSSYDKIIILLREHTGHDFSLYKNNTLSRRIERRKGIHQIEKLQNYVRFLQGNPKEIELLFKELLIGVTNFFRDKAVWNKLKEEILPNLISHLPEGYILRAWVPACSTGEEAYTLAMTFKETLEQTKNSKNITLQIFATDLDNGAIEIARRGLFSSSISADVSQDQLKKFFILDSEGYKVNSTIREMVVFAHQDVIKDPPFTKLDILTCRNMLIYMEPELQDKLISLFNYSLNSGGILLLGSAESLGNHSDGFEEIDSNLNIYKRIVSHLIQASNSSPSILFKTEKAIIEVKAPKKSVENIQTITDHLLLQKYAPASVLVNTKGDIVYITGKTGKYLEPSAGKANFNIYSMAREGLSLELPNAFRLAMQSYEPVNLHNIKIVFFGGIQYVDVTLQKIENPELIRGMVIIIFRDVSAPLSYDLIETSKSKGNITEKQKELENRLQRSYEDLQSNRQEMQSTNEELQSTNGELQSANEELTTSKEEMISLNEELQTLNNKLQNKVSEYVLAESDMKNLLNSTEIATLFLDKDLNIRRFTDELTNIIKLRNGDIGRPFTDIVSDLYYPEIKLHALQVIKTLSSIETAIETINQKWYNVRIMPYRTIEDKIDGLVITFSDISKAKKLESDLKKINDTLSITETRYRNLFESAKDGILILDAQTGMIKDVNPYMVDLLGYSKEQFFEKAIWEIGFLKDIIANKVKFLELQTKKIVRYEDLPIETARGEKINVEFVSNVYLVDNLKVIQCNIRNITDRKVIEDALTFSETRYRNLFESAKDGILILDAQTGMIKDVNPYMVDLLGYSKEQFFEKAIWEIGFLKDIIANKDKFLELQEKKIVRYEDLPIETANGEKINVKFLSNVYLVDDLKVVQCHIIDITERKLIENALALSETKYRSLFESAKDGILILDADNGKITDVNPYMIKMLGYSKEQFMEKAIWEIGFLKDIIANKDKFLELQQKEIVRYENLPLETADGNKTNVEFISNVYSIDNHKVIQCFIRNLIDRKISEESVKSNKNN